METLYFTFFLHTSHKNDVKLIISIHVALKTCSQLFRNRNHNFNELSCSATKSHSIQKQQIEMRARAKREKQSWLKNICYITLSYPCSCSISHNHIFKVLKKFLWRQSCCLYFAPGVEKSDTFCFPPAASITKILVLHSQRVFTHPDKNKREVTQQCCNMEHTLLYSAPSALLPRWKVQVSFVKEMGIFLFYILTFTLCSP